MQVLFLPFCPKRVATAEKNLSLCDLYCSARLQLRDGLPYRVGRTAAAAAIVLSRSSYVCAEERWVRPFEDSRMPCFSISLANCWYLSSSQFLAWSRQLVISCLVVNDIAKTDPTPCTCKSDSSDFEISRSPSIRYRPFSLRSL